MARINLNPALSTSFKLDIPGMDEVNYFVQSTDLPSVTMGGVDTPYQNWQTNVPSNRIEFEPITFSMIVDEDFTNYEKLYFWMVDITRTEPVVPTQMRDITLHVTNSSKVRKFSVCFHGAYPTGLGSIQLESNTADPHPLTCPISFRYQFFEFKRNAP